MALDFYWHKYTNTDAANLIAFYRLADASGSSTAADDSGNSYNGTASNVTFEGDTGPDGEDAATFNGTTSDIDIDSTGVTTAFDGDEGAVSVWFKAHNIGVWSDSTARYLFEFKVDANNFIRLYKTTTTGEMKFEHMSGGTSVVLTKSSITDIGWVHVLVSWSVNDDELSFFWNGEEADVNDTPGTWSGTPTQMNIGSQNATNEWYGSLALFALWDEPRSRTEATGFNSFDLPATTNTEYMDRVIAMSPIGYLPGNEVYEDVAEDLSGNDYDGTAIDVTLDQYTSPDSSYAGQWDDSNDSYIDWYSAGLSGAFDGNVGTFGCWMRVTEEANWLSGTKMLGYFSYSGTNNMYLAATSQGKFQMKHEGGGTTVYITTTEVYSGLDWYHVLCRWDTDQGVSELYVNGELLVSGTGLGIWTGSPGTMHVGGFGQVSNLNGSLTHAVLFDRYLSTSEIHSLASADASAFMQGGYHYKGYWYIPQPELIYQTEILSVVKYSTTDIIQSLQCSTYTMHGDENDVEQNMLALIGTRPGWDDLGRVRVRGATPGTPSVEIWSGENLEDGSCDPAAGNYITVFKDYRVWMKPPYAAGGAYFYDGVTALAGTVDDQMPIANGGPGRMKVLDDDDQIITCTFDASGSYAVADDAQLGGLTSDVFSGTYILTSNVGTPANAVDGNTGTYWQATGAASNLGKYLHVDLTSGGELAIRQFTITATGNNGPDYVVLQHSDDDNIWITAHYTVRYAWGTNEKKTYPVHYTGEHRYWRLVVFGSIGGGSYPPRIEEFELFGEDRTAGTSPYSWDVDDGTITVGTSTSEEITATFPEGFRYVTLTVTDTNTESSKHHIPVGAVNYARTIVGEPDYSGATITASTEFGVGWASRAFDNDNTNWWITSVPNDTGWLQIQFTSAQTVYYYEVDCYDLYPAFPTAWTLQGSNNGSDWTTLDTQTESSWLHPYFKGPYVIASPGAYTYYKIDITDNFSGTQVGISELNLYTYTTHAKTEGLIEKFEVTAHAMEPMGQAMEFTVHEELPLRVSNDSYSEIDNTNVNATASTTNGGNAASNAFDDNTSTFWQATATAGWLRANWDEGKFPIHAYNIYQNGAVAARPTDWTLEGSDDGTSWTIIDTQSSISWSTTPEDKTFVLDSVEWYDYYRINVSATGGSNIVIYELNFYEYDYSPKVIDGGLVMYMERDWFNLGEITFPGAGVTDAENTRFVGWMDEDTITLEGGDYDVLHGLSISCKDVGQRLNQLTDFTFMVEKDNSPAYGYQVAHANMDVYFYLMARWLSTATEVADFFWSYTADHYNIGLLAAQGSSIYDMINKRAVGIDHKFTCNKNGQLKIVPDLRTCATEFRSGTTAFATITDSDYNLLDYTYTRTPRFHWLYGSGVFFLPHDADHGSFATQANFSIAPGTCPGQGVNTDNEHERLGAFSDLGDDTLVHQQGSLYERLGRAYSHKIAYRSTVVFELAHSGDVGLDPAEAKWLELTIPASLSPYRDRSLTAAQGIIKRIDITHDHVSMSKTYIIEWEEFQSDYATAWAYSPT